MKRLLVLAFVTAVFFYAFNKTTYYAGIWQTRAKPTQSVEVVLPDGRALTGSLTREWDGRWSLLQGDARLDVNNYRMMTFPKPRDEQAAVGSQWRFWLPTGLLFLLYMVFIFLWLRGSARAPSSRVGAIHR